MRGQGESCLCLKACPVCGCRLIPEDLLMSCLKNVLYMSGYSGYGNHTAGTYKADDVMKIMEDILK